MEPLSRHGMVIAFDRPAFGLTERPLTWEGQNPYSQRRRWRWCWVCSSIWRRTAVLVAFGRGHVALQTALAAPERVSALVLVDPMVYNGGGPPGWVRPLLSSGPVRRLGLWRRAGC